MAQYQEIVTKAVIGKGKKSFQESFSLNTQNSPSKVLGCWIINNQYNSLLEEGSVYVVGSYEVHVWYAYEEDTKTDIVRYKQEYKDNIPFKMKNGEELTSKSELKAYCPLYPTCSHMLLENGNINLRVDKEFIVDAIGEAIIKVQVSQIIQDDWNIDEEIEKNINVDYINNTPPK